MSNSRPMLTPIGIRMVPKAHYEINKLYEFTITAWLKAQGGFSVMLKYVQINQ